MPVARVDFAGLDGFMERASEAVNKGLTAAAMTHANFVRASFTKGPRFGSSAPGQPPNMRRGMSGGLKSGVTFSASTNFRALSGVRKGVPYARMLELGSAVLGPIRPKRAKALPVPLNDQAKRLSEKGVSLRSLDLVMLKPRGKPPILVGRKKMRVSHNPGGGKTVTRNTEPVWILVRQVVIRARPYLRPALKNNRAAIEDAAFRAAQKVMRSKG